MSADAKELDRLVFEVKRGKKYRFISNELVSHIGEAELSKRTSFKEAVKGTRNKLHQVGGLYLERPIDYQRAFDELVEAGKAGEQVLRKQARSLMRLHTSTRERLGILEQFYDRLMRLIPAPKIILDVACGLNPLAIPWMGLPKTTRYLAFDIYEDMAVFLDQVIGLYGLTGAASVRDVIHEPPSQEADLALVLKSLPCLEQVEKGAGRILLESLQTRYIAVSYPVQGVGGRDRGMIETYQSQFEALVDGVSWKIERLDFTTELVFLMDKG